MCKLYFLSCLILLISVKSKAQQKPDTVKCYVQIMVPASGTVGLSKEIEDNQVFLNGGILLYTKAYAVSDSPGHYMKFLTTRRKELKNIWLPDEKPVMMKYNW